MVDLLAIVCNALLLSCHFPIGIFALFLTFTKGSPRTHESYLQMDVRSTEVQFVEL